MIVTIWLENECSETVTCDEMNWTSGALVCSDEVPDDPGLFRVHHVYAPGVWKMAQMSYQANDGMGKQPRGTEREET